MDQVKSNFFENQILEAIETVTNSIVSKLKFDQTILCTITDDSNKQNGIYEVTDKTSTFTATSSDTSYTKDMVVYVLIPQGKYENQKTIIGKYVDDTATAINHVASTENIIEIKKFSSLDASCEGWEEDSTKWSLLANKKNNQNDKITLSELFNISWDENTNIYTCVGLKAKFKTRLHDYLIKKGSYGLVLTLQGYKANDEGELKIFQDEYIFNNSEMYGDPYNYNDYVEHDIVFDLTDKFKDIKITGVRLDFYEKNDFLDINNELIPYSYLINGKEALYPDNLFVKDIDLIFGYTQDDILKEGIQIYTPDDFKYATREDSKNILLKWFVQNEIGSSQTAYGIIDELEEVPKENGEAIDTFSIYWYRYKIGNQEPDPILGEGYWEIIPGAVYRDKKFVHEMQNKKVWDVKTKTEVFVYKKDEYGNDTTEIEQEEAPELKYTLIEDNSGRYYKTVDNKLAIATDDILKDSSIQKYQVEMVLEPVYNFSEDDDLNEPFRYLFGPNELLSEEKIKAVLKCRKYEEVLTPDEKDETIQYVSFKESYDIYESNELLFENKNPADKTLSGINLIRNLKIECEDQSEGIYMIYNEDTGVISDPNKKDNILYAKFDNYLTKDILREQEHCKITWKIPKYSMVEPVDFKIPYKPITLSVEENGVTKEKKYYQLNELYSDDSEKELIKWTLDGEHYVCSYDWTTNYAEPVDKKDLDQSLIAHYALKDNYIRNTNDIIICEIEKYGKTYSTELKMNFGSAGVNGTKYSLIVYLEKEYGNNTEPQKNNPTSLTNVSYLDVSKKDVWVKVIAKLYDQNAKDITEGKTFIWKQYNHTEGLEIKTYSEKSNECYIRLANNAKSNASLSDFNIFKLEEYYGILEVCVDSVWAGNNTKLTSYYPVGVRLNDSIKQYVGANRLIYNTQGLAPEDNGFQAIHSLKIEKTDLVASPSEVSSWKLKLINSTSDTDYSYAPSFNKITVKEETVEVGEGEDKTSVVLYDKEIANSSTLTPTNLYYAEMKSAKMTILALDSSNNVLFAQPLYYGQDVYNISLLNNWNGNQIIDAEGNKILTALIGAGIKENNNTFSGVFMGNICDVGSSENGKRTGLLGFNQGSHTFGFHTDGTAFIGPPGQGRIEFDGNKGLIESYGYTEGSKGVQINLTSGIIRAYEGYFDGNITAKTGAIGGWTILENALYKNDNVTSDDIENNVLKHFIVSDDTILLNPEGNITIEGLSFTVAKYSQGQVNPANGDWMPKVDEDGNPVKDEDGNPLVEVGFWEEDSITAPTSDIVLSIGENFAVTKDGAIYANEAYLSGYVSSEVIPELSDEIIDIATGKVNQEATDRDLADQAEAKARAEADAAEKNAREEADAKEEQARIESDNGLRGKIGGVNFNTEGALSQVGTYKGNAVFIDSLIGSVGDTKYSLESGYYDSGDECFRKIAYKLDVLINLQSYMYYYDYDTGFQYRVVTKKPEDGEEYLDLEKYSDTLKEEDCPAKGYVYYNDTLKRYQFYRNRDMCPDTSATGIMSPSTTTFYIDLNTGRSYKWTGSQYILTGPEDNIVLFMVNKDGLLRANNAVIGGTIYAHRGYIGGWTIQHGGLNYGNIDNTNDGSSESKAWTLWITHANITPNEGLWVKNGKLFGYTLPSGKELSDYLPTTGDDEIDYDAIISDAQALPEEKQGYYGNWSTISNAKKCILNVGWNFAVDEDGTLYASGADLVGYTHQSDFDDLSGVVDDISDEIASWSEQYGIIRKYKEDTSSAYFAVGLEADATNVEIVQSKSGTTLTDESGNVITKVAKTVYWVTDEGKAYYYDGSLLKDSSLKNIFNVPRQGLFYASNGVISGTIYATNGWFSGGISASEGTIGNWEITSEGNFIGYAGTKEEYLSVTTLYSISSSDDEDLTFSGVEFDYSISDTVTVEKTTAVTCPITYTGYTTEDGETRYNYKITGEVEVSLQPIEGEDISVDGTFQNYNFYTTQLKKPTAFTDIETNVVYSYNTVSGYKIFKIWGTFSSSNYQNVTSCTFTLGYKYTRNATIKITSYNSLSDIYKFLQDKDLVDATDPSYLAYGFQMLAPSLFTTEDQLRMLYGSAFSINGSKYDNVPINGINYSNVNLSGDFTITRNGAIKIFPGVISILNSENENGFIHIDYAKNITSQIKNKHLRGFYTLAPGFSMATPNDSVWKIVVGDDLDEDISVFGITHNKKNESDYSGLVFDSNGTVYAAGNNPQLGHPELYWNNIYLKRFDTPTFRNEQKIVNGSTISPIRGGFHLNSSEPSNEFWPDALYTYNTYYQSKKDNYYSYVAFVRAVGDTSKKPSNVFLGCKSITSNNFSTTFQTSDEWTNNATYNFYIRFDGKAGFKEINAESLKINGTEFINASNTMSISSIETNSLTISSGASTTSNGDEVMAIASDPETYVTNQTLSLYGGQTTLSNASFSLNNGKVTINSSGLLKCPKIESTEIDFSSNSWSSLVLNSSGDLKLTFKYVSSSDRIVAYSPGLNTSKDSEKPCKGRDKALIRMDAIDGTLLNYRPLFSLQGSTAGKTWDFGINPRHAELEDASYQYSDELFLYGFSSSAYKNNKDASFSLGIGRRWSTNSDADDAVAGYNYIIPRSDIKLGTSSFKWKEIWCVNELNTSSDIRLKTIQNSRYLDKLLIMYNNIIPIAYKRKNISKEDSHDRIHIGFSAQNVEEELLKVSLTSMDFGGICIDNTSDPFFEDGKMYGLRYGEFHGLHVLKNQEQDRRILELEQKVQQLENKILELSEKGV